MTHLLPLSALHIAAPGVLDAVFGKDGKHEDAPYWTGPVIDVHPGGHRGFFHVTKILSGRFVDVLEIAPMMDLHDLALDLRIPTVAARLAGLCARAMGGDGDGWRMVRNTGPWALARYHSPGMAQTYHWTLAGWQGHNGVNLTLTGAETPESVLAKLTLTLAPKIAALKK